MLRILVELPLTASELDLLRRPGVEVRQIPHHASPWDLPPGPEVLLCKFPPRNLDDLPDPIAAKMRSYLTESHRLLRLLPLDVMFIATARNPTTIEQRRQAYQDKLDLLLKYCQAAIEA